MSLNLVEAIAAAAIGSTTLAALGWLWRAVVEPRRKRRRRKAVLGFDVAESDFAPTVIVESTTPTATSRYQRPTVGYGAVIAMANVAQLIAAVWRKARRSGRIEVWMDSDQIALRALSEESQHAIVIGGPISNRETRRYLDWLNEGVRGGDIELTPSDVFPAYEGAERCEHGTEAILYEEKDPSRGRALVVDGYAFRAALRSESGASVAASEISALSGSDYGLVIRGPARNRSGRLVIISGVHTMGLAGASRYLVDLSAVRPQASRRHRKLIHRDTVDALRHLSRQDNEDILLIIRTDFELGLITGTKLVAAWRIQFSGQ